MFPQIFGKYVLEREIAAGGMARVYLGTLRGAVGFEKRLVVKQIRAELASDQAFVRRFVEEAKTAVELSHPNIVPVYELGVEEGVYYIAMELCEGLTLAEVLAATGPLSPEEGAYVGIEICRALDYAHRRAGIVHRDVTPRNVMLDEEGAVRLIDFGIAAPAMGAKRRGELFGSPGHMPPEQIAGGQLTAATDVFAVGALLIEAWTGEPPFRRATPELSQAALEQAPAPLSEVVPELKSLEQLIASAVAHDAAERPESAEVLSRPLREFVKSADLGDLARRLGTRVRRARRKGRPSSPLFESDAKETGTRPLVKSSSEPATRTFAARDELEQWTRKLPSVPPPGDASTERPRESEDTAPTTTGPRSEPGRGARGARIAALALAAVVAIGLVGTRLRRVEPPAASASAMSAEPPARTASAAPVRPAPPPAPVAPSASVAPTAPKTPRPTSSGERLVAPPPSAEASQKAHVNLTSAPPAAVTVAGRARGTTPLLGLELPAGTHLVTFRNTSLDERVSASVTVAPGQTRSVHADFTAANPRIIVR